MQECEECGENVEPEDVFVPQGDNAEAGEGREGAEQCQGAQSVDGARAEPAGTLAPEEEIAKLSEENAGLRDQLLRKAADFDNYRKRMIREKQEAYDYANAALLADLLDSLDNFDRAIEAASQANDIKTVVDGVQMTKKQLVSMLETKYNLTAYGEAGDAFDPEQHEAIASGSANVAEPALAEVYLKGYKLKDRVIRHAKVMVNMPSEN
jgi:molecular chaperone GrpE